MVSALPRVVFFLMLSIPTVLVSLIVDWPWKNLTHFDNRDRRNRTLLRYMQAIWFEMKLIIYTWEALIIDLHLYSTESKKKFRAAWRILRKLTHKRTYTQNKIKQAEKSVTNQKSEVQNFQGNEMFSINLKFGVFAEIFRQLR